MPMTYSVRLVKECIITANSSMIIKNVIVLLDEINIQRRNGIAPYTAIIEATVSRTRKKNKTKENN